MSVPDWLSIASSVLSIIAFILGLLGMAKEKKRQTYSIRNSINFNIKNRNMIRSSDSFPNNIHGDSSVSSFVGGAFLVLVILYLLYKEKIASIIIGFLVTIAITGIFTALRVIRGSENYLPSRNPIMQVLFLLTPVIVISSYPLSCYLISHAPGIYYSKIVAEFSLTTQSWISSICTILAAAILLLVQFCSLLIPLTHGVLRKILVKLIKLWWAPILFVLCGLLISYIPYIRSLSANNLNYTGK